MTHIFDTLAADGAVHRALASFDLRFIFPAELELLVRVAGLRLVDVYGGYDLAPFGADSGRMIAVIAAPGRG
jgi:hypothetical protein